MDGREHATGAFAKMAACFRRRRVVNSLDEVDDDFESQDPRKILAHFFKRCHGYQWQHKNFWCNEKYTIAEWHGLAVDDNGDVTNLILPDNMLSGANSVVGWFALCRLGRLTVSFASSPGHIPKALCSLSKLVRLDLTNNEFHGIFPWDILCTKLSNLKVIVVATTMPL